MGNTHQTPQIRSSNNLIASRIQNKTHILSREELFKKKLLLEDWKTFPYHMKRRSRFLKELPLYSAPDQNYLSITKRTCKSAKISKDIKCYLSHFSPQSAFQAFKRSNMIETLTLDFKRLGSARNSINRLKILFQHIRTLKSLKSLVVIGDNFGFLEQTILSLICSSIKSSRSLCEFTLHLPATDSLPNEELLQNILKALKGLKSLKKLTINICDDPRRNKNHFSILAQGLGQLHPLSELSLGLFNCFLFDDQHLQLLCSSLLNHSSLKRLSLNIRDCGKLSNDGLQSLRSTLEGLHSLRSFSLKLPAKEMNRKPEPFFDKLQLTPFFSELNIELFTFGDSDLFVFQDLTSRLSQQEHLYSFSLICWDWPLKNNELVLLSRSLNSKSSLSTLSLEFILDDDVKDSAIEDLFTAIQKMTNLKSLTLKLKGEDKIGDKHRYFLSSALSQTTSLTTLHLVFDPSRLLTRKGTQQLSESLRILYSLRNLSLTFGGWMTLLDDSVTDIFTGIAGLQFLSAFYLDLNRYAPLKLKEVKFIAETLKGLVFLKTFSMIVKIPEEIFDSLKDVLIGAQFLRNVKFRDNTGNVIRKFSLN